MNILTPNASVGKPVMLTLTGAWLLSLIVFWFIQPFPIIPNPAEVAVAFGDQWQKGLMYELMTSFVVSIESIVLATVLGLALSYLSVIPAIRPIVELFGKLRFLSLTGVILIFILLAPNGHWLKVMVLTFAIMAFLVHDMVAAIDAIPQSRFDHARTLGLSNWMITREVVIRGTLHEAFEALRMNAAVAWMMLTMVEGLSRSEGGIGVLLLNLNRHMALDAIFGIQLLILFVGIGQDWLIKKTKNVVCPYAA